MRFKGDVHFQHFSLALAALSGTLTGGMISGSTVIALTSLATVLHQKLNAAEPGPPPAAALPASATNWTTSANLFTSIESLDNLQRLAPADRVSYRVIEDKEEAKSLVVTDSGELDVPYLGRVRAANKTCQALAGEIKATLEKEHYYRATVILAIDQLNKKRGNVYLAGQVRVSGPVEIPSDEVFTLSRAVLRGGGFADFADKKRVKVTRRGPSSRTNQVFVVNVSEILEKGRTGKDLILEAGDLVFVPSRLINF